jgi:hypothetical protein
MKRISAGGAGGVGVRERGAAVALAALPRLHLELTPSPGTPVCNQQDPLVRLKLKKLPPLRTVTNPAGALAVGTQSIATPMNRTVADAISNTLVLQTMAG